MVCTFFGHRDCPQTVCIRLKSMCEELIQAHGVEHVYVGNQGAFDRLAWRVLEELAETHPHIRCEVVLAYRPALNASATFAEWTHTVLPNGIENVPRSAAIPWRNQWMIQQSDYVVAYVIRPLGGAFRYTQLAKKQGKRVLYIAEQ